MVFTPLPVPVFARTVAEKGERYFQIQGLRFPQRLVGGDENQAVEEFGGYVLPLFMYLFA